MANSFFLARCQRAIHPLAAIGLLLATAGAAQAQTMPYAYTGVNQTYTVPAGVTVVQVVATGASGGNLSTNAGFAYGARVQATVVVRPGEVLTVVVGGQGTSGNGNSTVVAGGFSGGGAAKDYGSGGGATVLRRSGFATGNYIQPQRAGGGGRRGRQWQP